MAKRAFLHGIIAGILAALAGVIYLRIYQATLGADFHKIVNIGTIAGSTVFGCLLMSISYRVIEKFHKQKLKGWLNVMIVVLSFASIIVPISISLPLDIQNPELFPGLVIPMHFFPALAFFVLTPFFDSAKVNRNNEV